MTNSLEKVRTLTARLAVTAISAIVLVFSTAWTSMADAAIPHSRTIISRLAKNSGRGVYVIDQEVRFSGSEGVFLKERWLVQNAEVMRLTVQGEKPGDFRFDALYKDNRRTSTAPAAIFAPASASPNPELAAKVEPGKDTKTTSLPSDFFEPYLFFRTTTKYLEHFVKAKILPPSAARERPRVGNIATYKPTPEVGVRLGRSAGAVAWVFGEPTPVDAKNAFPGAWIEQDSFLLRKIRHLSQSEMTLNEHASSGGGLRLARERSIIWRSNDPNVTEPRAVTIKVTSVKHYPDKSLAAQFLPSSITANELRAARLPDAPAVREFYTRFR